MIRWKNYTTDTDLGRTVYIILLLQKFKEISFETEKISITETKLKKKIEHRSYHRKVVNWDRTDKTTKSV